MSRRALVTSLTAALTLLLTALPGASAPGTSASAASAPGTSAGESALGASTPAVAAQDAEAPRFRALVFSKVTNFYHQSIPAGQALIEQLGTEHNFEVVVSDDSAIFNDDDLATFDVVIFNNTNSTPQSGDLLNAEQRAAFTRYIQAGGGFTGLHAATAAERDWAWYEGLVGSIFTNHPAGTNPDGTINGRVKVTDRVHPSTANLPELWEFEEEWYNWNQRVVGDVHVLAWVDTKVGIAGLTEGPNHPFSWCQIYDGGRSWYTAGGHSAAAFSDPEFVEHLRGGIEWAAGVVDGDCGATAEDSFDKVRIADNPADPMALGFLSANEVIFVQRGGAVQIIDQTTLDITTAGTLDVYTPDSDGLLGIAVDPDFVTNRWIYLTYSHPTEAKLQISRFTLTTDDTLDMASEQVLLEIPTYRGLNRSGVHMGGAMDFDAQGNLYVSIGDNIDPFESSGYAPIDERPGRAHFDAQSTAANTADLRGKLLRITPTDDGGYTIPAGNLFDPATHDPQVARPEIYAMGFRNPFRFRVDEATGNVMLGEHSPDARSDSAARGPQAHGEWNVITEAGNYGWPYCFGPNRPFIDYDFAANTSGEPFDCAAPVNTSPNNTGLEQLPPVNAATMWENYGATPDWPEFGTGGIAPHGGPVYNYDPELDSDTKFPEFYDGKWFISEWDRRWIKTVSFLTEDHQGERYDSAAAGDVFSVDPWGIDQTWIRPMDMDFGPDGSLYVIEWGSNFGGALRGQPNVDAGIYRIDYVAGNRPPVANASATPADGQAPLTVQFSSAGSGHPSGIPVTMHWDFGDGTTSTEANPTHTYTANGEYTARLTVTDSEERTALAVVQIVVGNTRPAVTMAMPPEGGFFDFGDTVPYRVEVDDVEDGSIADGGIACADVELQTLLGHDEHAHPLETYQGCEGTVPTMTDGGHGGDVNLYYVLEGVYVDQGGEGVGTLTGAATSRLRTKFTEAEYFDGNNGVTPLSRPTSSGGVRLGEIRPGDWVSYDPVNLRGIESVTLAPSSGGQGGFIELRRDAPEGELLGSIEVLNTGSWDQVQEQTIELADPGDTFALYVVFREREGYTPTGPDLMSLDWLEFNGPGVADQTAPVVTVAAEPQTGEAPLTVALSGSATSPLGHEIVSYEWAFGDGTSGSGAEVSHVYTEPGEYRAVLTATDSEGNTGSESIMISVTGPDPGEPPVCRGPLSDEFDGDALDKGRWTKIVREDDSAYSIGDGALTLPTVPGRVYSTQNNDGTNIVLQPMPEGEWEATTKLTVDAAHQFQKAGIIVYGDDDNYARSNIVGLGPPPDGAPGRKFEFIHETDGVPRNQTGDSTTPLPDDFPTTFYLRVASDGANLTTAYSADGQTWEPFGRPASLAAIPDPHIGLISNKSHTTAEVIDADFDWFRVSPDEPVEEPVPDDEFDGDELDACRWDRIIRENPDDYRLADGQLHVNTTSGGNFGANNTPPVENQFLQSVAPDEDWLIETKVHAPLEQRFQQVGLQYYQDDGSYVKFDLVADNLPGASRALRVELRSEIGDVPQQPQPNLQPAPENPGDEWWLRLQKVGSTFTGWISVDGTTWIEMPAPVENAAITDGGYGPIHQGRGQTAPVEVAFDYFRVNPENEPEPPEVSAVLDPAAPDGANGWYVSPVTVTLTSDDADATLQWRRAGEEEWIEWTAPFKLDLDGEHSIEYRAVRDPVESEIGTVDVAIDQTPPAVNASLEGEQDANGAYMGSVTVTLAADDATSGVVAVEYRLDGSVPFGEYTGPFEVTEPGQYVLGYHAFDSAGTRSEHHDLEFTVVPAEPVACPEPDPRPTVVVGDVDSGVPNRATADGCTINDLILDDQTWPSHGDFVRHVEAVLRPLVVDGLITERERGTILRAAASSDVARNGPR